MEEVPPSCCGVPLPDSSGASPPDMTSDPDCWGGLPAVPVLLPYKQSNPCTSSTAAASFTAFPDDRPIGGRLLLKLLLPDPNPPTSNPLLLGGEDEDATLLWSPSIGVTLGSFDSSACKLDIEGSRFGMVGLALP